MITYNKLISHAKPFFLSRGWDMLANNDNMLFYANTSIQDIFNSDNATFTYTNETLTWVANWDKMKFTTVFNIRKIQKVRWYNAQWSEIPLIPTLFFQDCTGEVKFTTWNNEVLTSWDITIIDIIYIKEYTWVTENDLNSPIQVPDRYIPAIIKFMYDWAAPINLMAGEAVTTDFFGHWINRVNQLKDDDALTDYVNINPAM